MNPSSPRHSPLQPSKPLPTLQDILLNKDGLLEPFKKCCDKMLCTESIDFWLQAQLFTALPQIMYKEFLAENSPNPINITWQQREEVENTLTDENFKKSLLSFQSLQRAMYTLLLNNVYPKFMEEHFNTHALELRRDSMVMDTQIIVDAKKRREDGNQGPTMGFTSLMNTKQRQALANKRREQLAKPSFGMDLAQKKAQLMDPSFRRSRSFNECLGETEGRGDVNVAKGQAVGLLTFLDKEDQDHLNEIRTEQNLRRLERQKEQEESASSSRLRRMTLMTTLLSTADLNIDIGE